jgi:hypothetical protein
MSSRTVKPRRWVVAALMTFPIKPVVVLLVIAAFFLWIAGV